MLPAVCIMPITAAARVRLLWTAIRQKTAAKPAAGGAFTNLFKTPEKNLEVGCEAVNCVYNEQRHCQAEHIGIAGDGAVEASQTECSSFRAR